MKCDPAFMRLVFEQMPGYFFMKDRGSHFIGCNAAFAEFAGETMESLIGKHETDMPWAAEAEHFMRDDQRVMESGEGLYNYREPKHGDSIITNKVPFRDASGAIVGVIGNFIIIPDDQKPAPGT
ncbi:MAG: PAS domain-containing protein [Phycisphaerales bacterium]|jgi:PAS domain S-box-containing protein|nr:PAS domain-containing protein [Phycisphaerales bacterium]